MKIHYALILASALFPIACGQATETASSAQEALAVISSEDQAANEIYLNDAIDSAAETTPVEGSKEAEEETKADIKEERLAQMVATVLKNLDADASGTLTLEEFLVGPEKRAKEKEIAAEKLAKIKERMTADFTKFAGEDKVLSSEELKELLKSVAPRVGHHRKHMFPGKGKERVQKSASEIIAEFDKDADGKLSAPEIEAMIAAKRAEMEKFREERRHHGHEDKEEGGHKRGESDQKPDDSMDDAKGSDGRSRSGGSKDRP